MKLLEAIYNADNIRPNAIPNERKAAWIYELEGDFAEMMGVPVPVNSFNEAPDDVELLMPYPKDRCYELYVAAMIDHENQDMKLYNKDITLANAARDDACAWWRRNHRPDSAGNWKVW